MFIKILFLLGSDRLLGLLSFVHALIFPYSRLSSYRLRLSHCLLSFLLFPLHECFGKHSCMSSPFPIVILNGPSTFLSLEQEKLNMPSGFVPEVAVQTI